MLRIKSLKRALQSKLFQMMINMFVCDDRPFFRIQFTEDRMDVALKIIGKCRDFIG